MDAILFDLTLRLPMADETPSNPTQPPMMDTRVALRETLNLLREDYEQREKLEKRKSQRTIGFLVLIGIIAFMVGGHMFTVIHTMEDDMTNMSKQMTDMSLYMNSMHENMASMNASMGTMNTNMASMSGDMRVMRTAMVPMAQNVAVMSANMTEMNDTMKSVPAMQRDVHRMTNTMNYMQQDTHWMRNGVGSMARDTGAMGQPFRAMDFFLPY